MAAASQAEARPIAPSDPSRSWNSQLLVGAIEIDLPRSVRPIIVTGGVYIGP